MTKPISSIKARRFEKRAVQVWFSDHFCEINIDRCIGHSISSGNEVKRGRVYHNISESSKTRLCRAVSNLVNRQEKGVTISLGEFGFRCGLPALHKERPFTPDVLNEVRTIILTEER